ncbi:hypothetical protein [Microvirga guangxiensis]|uniref:Uncharacterized protein n=1 Tax=Microvirga guangxiensis TaxID=549386 RepID=A0A1G5DRF5_9HYPH|nr:hypothetical protein [Microvirga guangxiensis]SCY17306.1 hypothetical protein SAMN02927923_00757 [Microvirga guangxiensis]
MKAALHKVLLIVVEEITSRLIGAVVLMTWMLAAGVIAGCLSLFDPTLEPFYLAVIVASATTIGFLALWHRLSRRQS